MVIAAFLRSFQIPGNLCGFFFDLFTVNIIKMKGICSQLHDFLIFDKVYGSRMMENGRYIRCHKVAGLSLACNERTILSCRIHLIGMILEQDSQRIGALYPMHHSGNRFQRISFIIVIQQVCYHFGVRVGHKRIALALQKLFQLHKVLNDAVMDNRNRLILVKMGMGVGVGRHPVGGPAGMADACSARQQMTALGQGIQHLQPSHGLGCLDFSVIVYSDTRRIISAVFQLGQSVQKDRRCLLFSDVTYNSTHNPFLQSTLLFFPVGRTHGTHSDHPSR